jgi:cation diffusion facilitator family transporter
VTQQPEAPERLRAGWLSLAVAVFVLGGKLLAWRITDSTAVLSDALESLVNVLAAVLLILSLRIAARPHDRDHPYGHGKIEFFSAGAEGTLIGVAALAIMVTSVIELLRGPSVQRLDLGLLLVSAASAANLLLGLYLLRLGRRTRSLALEADGAHLLTDVWTSAGVLVGLAVVWVTDYVRLDPLIAIAVALQILYTGYRLVRRSVAGLMDEADEKLLWALVSGLEDARRPEWIDVHSLRSFRSGPVVHVDFHMVVPRFFDVEKLHAIDDELHDTVRSSSESAAGDGLLVHFDPCRPRHCPGCRYEPCPVRSAPCAARKPFVLERAIRGDESVDSGRPL